MRVAFFEAIGGAAGDMILGALLDAGLSFERLEAELGKLPLTGYRLRHERTEKQGTRAIQFRVDLGGQERNSHAHHGGSHSGGTSTAEDYEWPLAAIERVIRAGDLGAAETSLALRILGRLGQAEARVRGKPIEEVGFPKIDAVDSVVDIVGAAVAFELLHLERIYASPLPLGSGSIETGHGTYSLPAPTALELATSAGVPIITDTAHGEQVTPTGAAILTTLAEFHRPAMTVERMGYGAGEADLTIPNVLRVSIGVSREL